VNIRPIHFIDAAAMTAALLTRHKTSWSEPLDGVQLMPLRATAPDEERSAQTPLLRDWPSAKGVLAQIKKVAAALLEGNEVVFGDVVLERFAPQAYTPWLRDEGDYADRHYRLHLPLVPSPGAMVICGGETWSPAALMLTWVNHQALHSTLNLAEYPFIRLVVDVEKPTVE
jgi:hypothetical protein